MSSLAASTTSWSVANIFSNMQVQATKDKPDKPGASSQGDKGGFVQARSRRGCLSLQRSCPVKLRSTAMHSGKGLAATGPVTRKNESQHVATCIRFGESSLSSAGGKVVLHRPLLELQ